MLHSYVSTNGIRLHVVEDGPVDGPPVVLLHGFPDFWYGFRHQMSFLAQHGYRVLVPDQRGYGESDKPPRPSDYAIDTLAADIAGLIETMGHEKASIVGHDWGGGVAWHLAMRRPEKVNKLVVLNAPHPLVMERTLRKRPAQLLRSWYMFFFQIPFLPERLLSFRGGRGVWESFIRETAPGAFTEADFAHYSKAWSRPGALTGMVNWYRALLWARPRAPSDEEAKIRVPTMLIWGDAEKYLLRSMAPDSIALCEDGRLEMIEGASHWVKDDAPDRVNDLLQTFL